MPNLEDLVPPLELCRKIPKGDFAESAMVWVIKAQEEPEVWERARTNSIPPIWSKVPAPTLAEVLTALRKLHDRHVIVEQMENNSLWIVQHNDEFCRDALDTNPATAALKLWLHVKGVK